MGNNSSVVTKTNYKRLNLMPGKGAVCSVPAGKLPCVKPNSLAKAIIFL